MTIRGQMRWYVCFSLCASFMLLAAGTTQAQSSSLESTLFLGHVVDKDGNALDSGNPSDLEKELYRKGPGTPMTRSDGSAITLADYVQATGQIEITAKAGGGTDVAVEVQGLLPNELYSVWAGYWQDPGFPSGERIAFGAVGTGNDQISDENGAISLMLIQPEGPMTVEGEAPFYAPISPTIGKDMTSQIHEGYTVGVAYHFNDPLMPPYTGGPGDPSTWALHVIADFPAVPEPSSMSLMTLALGCMLLRGRRRMRR